MKVSEFRLCFTTLDAVTAVTNRGAVIGYWIPQSVEDRAEERLDRYFAAQNSPQRVTPIDLGNLLIREGTSRRDSSSPTESAR